MAIRNRGEVFGYWESRTRRLVSGLFETAPFFHHYLLYQQRDIHGFELDIAPEKISSS